jgi:hypothetical protein
MNKSVKLGFAFATAIGFTLSSAANAGNGKRATAPGTFASKAAVANAILTTNRLKKQKPRDEAGLL